MKKSFRVILIILSALIIAFIIIYGIDVNQRKAFNRKMNAQIDQATTSTVISINIYASVIAKDTIVINAPIEKVWNVLTGIDGWPQWQTGVTKAVIKGSLQKGTDFEWESKGINFSSTIHTCNHYKSFGWTGTTFGAQAIHNWTFKEREGKTLVIVEESLEGILPTIMKHTFQSDLEKGMKRSLEDLRRQVMITYN